MAANNSESESAEKPGSGALERFETLAFGLYSKMQKTQYTVFKVSHKYNVKNAFSFLCKLCFFFFKRSHNAKINEAATGQRRKSLCPKYRKVFPGKGVGEPASHLGVCLVKTS